ncbi:hypothetical protein [uncultured Chitinophaga sp.]|jgi:hypothetical protein|uniref:hypothetical protein n=1 Tax=uncultured Chitinophaga sp. TaxID=339340 RepID=UPI00260ADD99|nr:hypothetical protein [uncultured Chitinophaga sp.]
MSTPEENIDDLYERLKHLVKRETPEETAARLKKENAWKEEYAQKSFEERVAYWSGDINRNMRSNGESSGDEYSWLSPAWYDEIKSFEPDIDKILAGVSARLGMMFDADRFYRAIGRQKPI